MKDTSPRSKILCTYLQNPDHLPHVKKQAHVEGLYAHVYKTQTSLSLRATSSTREETSPRPKIICTLPRVKKQALAQDHMHMSTEPRLASLYVQHLPHVKKQALAQRSYAHVYRTQTSLSLHATSFTREETSPHPKIICTLPHVKKLPSPKDHMHMSTKPRLASLHATSSTHEETSPHPKIICTPPHVKDTSPRPKIICTVYRTWTSLSLCATSSTREETSPHPKIICTLPHVKETSPRSKILCTYLQNPDHLPHVKKQAHTEGSYAHVYRTQTSLSLRAASSTCEETSPCPKIICTVYRTQTSLSLHATSSTREETSPHPKIICTLPHVKKQALTQRSYAHVYKTQTSLSTCNIFHT